MREILFRGKREDNGEWVYGYYCNCVKAVGMERIPSIQQTDDNSFYFRGINPETVGQFTGLMDKNGKKIFEGDIIKLYLRDDVITVGDIRYSEEDCRFKFWEDFEYPYGFDITTPFEVIGNIHDNPELLGE